MSWYSVHCLCQLFFQISLIKNDFTDLTLAENILGMEILICYEFSLPTKFCLQLVLDLWKLSSNQIRVQQPKYIYVEITELRTWQSFVKLNRQF